MGRVARNHYNAIDGGGGATNRGIRLETLILEEINAVLVDEIGDRRLDGVRVTLVELAGDGSCARLWVSRDPRKGDVSRDVLGALDRAAAFLRLRLAEALAFQRVPELRFRIDPSMRSLPETKRP